MKDYLASKVKTEEDKYSPYVLLITNILSRTMCYSNYITGFMVEKYTSITRTERVFN